MNALIIGDIHGCYHELVELLDRAAIGTGDLVVSVGDLVDRRPDPRAVLDFFRARPNSVVLMGNHERKHVRGVLSYGQQITKLQLGDGYASDVAWMVGLPYHFERDDVRVVHWGLFPGVPLADVPEDVRAGTTSGEARLRERYGDRPWYDAYDDDKPASRSRSARGPLGDRSYGVASARPPHAAVDDDDVRADREEARLPPRSRARRGSARADRRLAQGARRRARRRAAPRPGALVADLGRRARRERSWIGGISRSGLTGD